MSHRQHRRPSFVSFASFVAVAGMTACATTAPHPPAIGEIVGTWQPVAAIPAGARIPTLNIGHDGSISGNGGVNRFRGAIEVPALAEGKWRLSALTTTRMAGTPDAMQLEDQFLRGVANADRAELTGDELRLHRGRDQLLTFVRVQFR